MNSNSRVALCVQLARANAAKKPLEPLHSNQLAMIPKQCSVNRVKRWLNFDCKRPLDDTVQITGKELVGDLIKPVEGACCTSAVITSGESDESTVGELG